MSPLRGLSGSTVTKCSACVFRISTAFFFASPRLLASTRQRV